MFVWTFQGVMQAIFLGLTVLFFLVLFVILPSIYWVQDKWKKIIKPGDRQ